MTMYTVDAQTIEVSMPAAVVPAGYHFEIQDTEGNVISVQNVGEADPSATFDLAPGAYRAVAWRVNADGNALQAPVVSPDFTVTAGPTTQPVAVVISLHVEPA